MKEKQKVFFGGTGKLGTVFLGSNPEYLSPSRNEVDITSIQQVREYLQDVQTGIVIHAAAVVGAKESLEDVNYTYLVNVIGTDNIAKVCDEIDARLVYISSVSVFNGKKGNYCETDVPSPLYFYGLTKLLGEKTVEVLKNHVVIRTDFFNPLHFKYKQVYTDHYSSKIHVALLVNYLTKIANSNFRGLLNVGQEKDILFNILKQYIPDIKGIKIAESTLPNFPKDLSLDLTLLHQLFP